MSKAKSSFSKLLAQVMEGEQVSTARAGTPIARLVPGWGHLVN
ncbi:MAG: type II toxin-antitoxin system prevent-host-death family antitoxin [Bacillota bacterium]